MKLKHLTLDNFAQHGHFECSFSAGLNGILGPNGSGKSNILEGIRYAITGTSTYPIDNYVKIGSTGIGSVELVFTDEPGINEYTIRRVFTTPRSVVLTTPEGTIRGAKTVEAYLTDSFGIDVDLVKSIQIVSQDSWVSLFKLPASARITLLQHIFACDFLKSKRESLRQFIMGLSNESGGIEDVIKTYNDMIAEKRNALLAYVDIPATEEVAEQLSTARGEYDSLTERYNASVYYEQITNELAKINKYLDSNPEPADKDNSKLSDLNNDIRFYKNHLNNDEVELQIYEASIIPLLQTLKPLFQRAEEVTKDMTTWCSANGRDYSTRWAEVKRKKEEASINLKHILELGVARCPCCNKPLTNDERAIIGTRLNSEILQLEEEANRMRTNSDLYDGYVDELIDLSRRYYTALESAHTIPTYYMDQVRSLNPTTMSHTTFTRVYTAIPHLLNWKYLEYVKRVDDKKAELEASCSSYRELIADLESQLDVASVEYERVSRLKTNLAIARAKKAEYEAYIAKYPHLGAGSAELKGQVDVALKKVNDLINLRVDAATKEGILQDIASLEAKVKAAKTKALASEALTERKQALEGVVSILSPDKFPRAIVLGWLRILESSINEYLAAFNAPYTALVQNDTDIHCKFPDKTVPSWALSGGQQVMLAIAWRLALHNTFANSEACGFITLDEPTTFLDDDNIDNLLRVMEDIKRIANTSNLQILVITHEEALSPLFDAVIRL